MYERLIATLQLFMGAPITLHQRGERTVMSYASRLPDVWLRALDPTTRLPEALALLWEPLSNTTRLLAILSMHVRDLALLISEEEPELPRLAYLCISEEWPDEPFAWVGALPMSSALVRQCEEALQVELPRAYKQFSAIHGEFLKDGWSSLGIRRPSEWYPVAAKEIIAFCGDSGGNEQCFDLRRPSHEVDWTVDWDHETEILGNPTPFWPFVEQFIARNMKPT